MLYVSVIYTRSDARGMKLIALNYLVRIRINHTTHIGEDSVNIKPGVLKPFIPFNDMPPEYVIVAAKFGDEMKLQAGDSVLEKNAEDEFDYFLIDGELEMTDIYDQTSTLRAKTPHALKPLPGLRLRRSR